MSKYKSLCYIKTYHQTSFQQELPWWSTFLLEKMEHKNALPEQTYTRFVPIFSSVSCLHLPMDLIILLISNYLDRWVHLASMTTDHRWTGSPCHHSCHERKVGRRSNLSFSQIPARLQPQDVYSPQKGFLCLGGFFNMSVPVVIHGNCAVVISFWSSSITLGINKTSLVLWRISWRGNLNKDKAK